MAPAGRCGHMNLHPAPQSMRASPGEHRLGVPQIQEAPESCWSVSRGLEGISTVLHGGIWYMHVIQGGWLARSCGARALSGRRQAAITRSTCASSPVPSSWSASSHTTSRTLARSARRAFARRDSRRGVPSRTSTCPLCSCSYMHPAIGGLQAGLSEPHSLLQGNHMRACTTPHHMMKSTQSCA